MGSNGISTRRLVQSVLRRSARQTTLAEINARLGRIGSTLPPFPRIIREHLFAAGVQEIGVIGIAVIEWARRIEQDACFQGICRGGGSAPEKIGRLAGRKPSISLLAVPDDELDALIERSTLDGREIGLDGQRLVVFRDRTVHPDSQEIEKRTQEIHFADPLFLFIPSHRGEMDVFEKQVALTCEDRCIAPCPEIIGRTHRRVVYQVAHGTRSRHLHFIGAPDIRIAHRLFMKVHFDRNPRIDIVKPSLDIGTLRKGLFDRQIFFGPLVQKLVARRRNGCKRTKQNKIE